MQAYLAMLAAGAVQLGLCVTAYSRWTAAEGYGQLKSDARMMPSSAIRRGKARNGECGAAAARTVLGRYRCRARRGGRICAGDASAESRQARQQSALRAVVSRSGANAKAVATHYRAACAATDVEQVLQDEQVQVVLIATGTTSPPGAQSAAAGKHYRRKAAVPHAGGARSHRAFYRSQGERAPVLMTGFIRRFAPAVARLREALSSRSAPLMVTSRMNAGYIPTSHWVHDRRAGGATSARPVTSTTCSGHHGLHVDRLHRAQHRRP